MRATEEERRPTPSDDAAGAYPALAALIGETRAETDLVRSHAEAFGSAALGLLAA